jgi:3'(2'), 5'-bisphosphate nucleotidase
VNDVQPENWLGELLPTEGAFAPEASQPIMTVCNELDLTMEPMRHASPRARAGLRPHHLILNSFVLLSPNWPVFSQHSPNVPFDPRESWRLFWLANPLDLTQEFLQASGEFWVKIALIESNAPIPGIMDASMMDTRHYAGSGAGADKVDREITTQVKAIRAKRATLRPLATPSLRSWEQSPECSIREAKKRRFIVIVMGSSPKFCPVAEGYSALCSTLTETMDGDAAAAHCILKEAGACCRLGWQFHEVQPALTTKLRHPAHGSVDTIRYHPETRAGCLAGRSWEDY